MQMDCNFFGINKQKSKNCVCKCSINLLIKYFENKFAYTKSLIELIYFFQNFECIFCLVLFDLLPRMHIY
jgi:hypothetical protein